ncbi:MAG: phosphate permease [Deltaproteobacteria bacterium]|nr:MAG: phosphate permease [Deltaproteobacteria bacterium]
MELIFTPVILFSLLVGFYMAWNIGANDLANSMGTSVGSRALSIKQAILVAAILEFGGAVFVGSHVTDTVRKKIVDVRVLSLHIGPEAFICGMLAAILGAAIWITIATYFSLPVSTTHSIVGAVVGFGIVAAGIDTINFGKLAEIVASWIISPIAGGILSFLTFTIIKREVFDKDDKMECAKRVVPYFVGFVSTVLVLSMVYKGLKNLHLDMAIGEAFFMALVIGGMSGGATHLFLKNCRTKVEDEYQQVENFFRHLQILTACYVAFAHGANDVANAVGPLAAIVSVARTGDILQRTTVPLWVLVIGGIGIALGIATWGQRVIETIGKRITEITFTRGFSAEFGAATSILICSKLGLPVSTSHTLVGSVVGVGFARGIGAIDLGVIRDILVAWLLTIPVAAGLTVVIYELLLLIV